MRRKRREEEEVLQPLKATGTPGNVPTVNDYIREFQQFLEAAQRQASKKPPDDSTRSAEKDVKFLRSQLDWLQKAQKKGNGHLEILREMWEWDAIKSIQQRYSEYRVEQKSHMSPPSSSHQNSLNHIQKIKAGLSAIKEGTKRDGSKENIAPQEPSPSSPNPFSMKPDPRRK